MVNHFFDDNPPPGRTRCGEYEGMDAFHVSANGWVSCNECMDKLTPAEREDEWYGRTD